MAIDIIYDLQNNDLVLPLLTLPLIKWPIVTP